MNVYLKFTGGALEKHEDVEHFAVAGTAIFVDNLPVASISEVVSVEVTPS